MRKMLRGLWLLLACATIAACGGESPPPTPDPGVPPGETRVTGTERLGWSQPAADTQELSRFEYAIYIDGARTTLSGVMCGSTASPAGFECSAPLPPLTAGSHDLELATFFTDQQGVLESGRSGPLRVFKTGAAGSQSTASGLVMTAEGVQLILEPVAEGLHDPTDLAFGTDGTILIAQRDGTVHTLRDGALLPDAALDLSGEVALPQGGLLAIALDPAFDESGLLYALYAAGAPRGGLEFLLARFRSVQGIFGERAVLLDRVPASPAGASGALRVGPDGKLYVALDSAADTRRAGSFATYNGKVLRLNADATTPDDQPGFTPIYSLDHPQPRALDWQPGGGELWVIDEAAAAGGRLSAVGAQSSRALRTAPRTSYTLPEGTGASSASFYRGSLMPMFAGNLFIAADTGRQLIRLQFDRDSPTRVLSVDRLLDNQIGPVRVVAEGRDGALYVASDVALYRLRP